MAFDKVIDSALLDAGMTATANAIRQKTGGLDPIEWDSANGFKAAVEEMAVMPELPKLDNPGTASDMASGKELIDQDGNVVTGTLGEVAEGANIMQNNNVKLSVGQLFVAQVPFSPPNEIEGAILRPGANIVLRTPAENLGDATAADVAAGKTFTSASGLKITGTASGGTGGSFTVTDDGAGNVTITSSAITDTDGTVVIA